jgi:hypothetical protein
VVNFTPLPLYPLEKKTLVPIEKMPSGPQSRSGRFGEEKKYLAPAGVEKRDLLCWEFVWPENWYAFGAFTMYRIWGFHVGESSFWYSGYDAMQSGRWENHRSSIALPPSSELVVIVALSPFCLCLLELRRDLFVSNGGVLD